MNVIGPCLVKWALSIIWLLLAALFFKFGRFHRGEAKKSIPPFQVTQRALQKPGSGVDFEIGIAGTPLDQPLEDFVRDFNEYLAELDESSRRANRTAALDFFIGSFMMLVSILLQWQDDLLRVLQKVIGSVAY